MTEENSRLGTWVPVRIDDPPNDRDALAYIPPPLPLAPPLDLTPLLPLLEQAGAALSGLNSLRGVGCGPKLDLLLRLYIMREATLSYHIDGTQTFLQELFAPKGNHDDAKMDQPGGSPAVHLDDFRETWNYTTALEYGLMQIRSSDGLPLGLQLLCEMHRILLHGSVRGANKAPGEFRKVQNFIPENGVAAYIPPPPEQMQACLKNFEKQLNDTSSELPPLVQAAILHAQFEAIHPFMDGNGQIGRLLIVLFLCHHKILNEPSLYLSLYFKKHRAKYFSCLNRTYAPGGWEAWIKFFLECVCAAAHDVRDRTEDVQNLLATDRARLMENTKATKTTLAVYDILAENGMAWAATTAKELECSTLSAEQAFDVLEEMGIAHCQLVGKKRTGTFEYQKYMDILIEGGEPLPRNAHTAPLRPRWSFWRR